MTRLTIGIGQFNQHVYCGRADAATQPLLDAVHYEFRNADQVLDNIRRDFAIHRVRLDWYHISRQYLEHALETESKFDKAAA